MSERFRPLPTEQLATWISSELAANDSVLGIPRGLFFVPDPSHRFATTLYGHPLDTPIGVAAGPHSQLAANIVAAWLCGARLIELKTVQTLDAIAIPKPCIAMQDAGYNVEWSQELTLDESLDQYLSAWALVHALHGRLGFPGERPGVVFNLSVGYDLRGILQPNVQRFLERATRSAGPLSEQLERLARAAPDLGCADPSAALADSVTVSTMHGCPPEEIGGIARHLMETWGLHTSIKLNPTLLGPATVREILNRRLGYREIEVPNAAFEHDLRFEQAVALIDDLRVVADRCGVQLGLKLANTLEVANRGVFDPALESMYLSGRPLHALVVVLAHRLTEALDGRVAVSFCGGADAFNVAGLVAAGLHPVTVCSDLLRPPGYLRLSQYLEEIGLAMDRVDANGLDDLAVRSSDVDPRSAARACLARYAERVLDDPTLRRDRFDRSHTKTDHRLGTFDCIRAPCTDACAVEQRVPEYMRLVRAGRIDEAAAITRADNPLAAILGRACHHPCEGPCLRTHLDDPLAIREVKRFIMDHEPPPPHLPAPLGEAPKVAVVGAGPCGLAAATFLARAGVRVTLLEARPAGGGMVSATIPGYRADPAVIGQDLAWLAELGVEIRYGRRVGRDLTVEDLRRDGFEFVVLAAGAPVGRRLGISGEASDGVWDGLELLRAARAGTAPPLTGAVAVVGGGDAAMDCARTALRLGADRVTVLYRRTVEEMPAQREERRGAVEEGVEIRELVAPRAVVETGGRMVALLCVRTRLADPDESGRPRPLEVAGSEFELQLDTLVVAVGQEIDPAAFGGEPVRLNSRGFVQVDGESSETSVRNLFAGGDLAGAGPATIVEACGDGRRIAAAILSRAGIAARPPDRTTSETDVAALLRRRSRRQLRAGGLELPPAERAGFVEVVQTLTPDAAAAEAARCLDCDLLCSACEWVCPNRAIVTYRVEPCRLDLPVLEIQSDAVRTGEVETFAVTQPFQVAVLADLCNECGNCTTFCPTRGRPFHDKPRLFLHRRDFEAAEDNAFRIVRRGSLWAVQGRVTGAHHEVVLGDPVQYAVGELRLELAPDALAPVRATSSSSRPTTLSLATCAAMWTLVRGLRGSLPWLPVAEDDDTEVIGDAAPFQH